MHFTPGAMTQRTLWLIRLAQSDGVSHYIDWAVKKNFGVMDINVPQYITHPEVTCSVTIG